ncbi:unnamed protein product [Cuscuta campestris]|uniref:Uncharacterized protein n=1 Tax=Cuscuta campestris TaxID=132261 RepID=A0A484LIE3_9ASTE|nr:unnamed protein product [Cuscuta campestris]
MQEATKYPGVWYLDNGCSRHMTGDASLLSNLIPYDAARVTFGGSNDFGLTKGLGNLVYKGLTIQAVSYVEGLNYNLLSISQFYDKGYSLEFCKDMASLKNISTNEVILTRKRIRNIYEVMGEDVKEACLISKGDTNLLWLWHKRLSHLNFKTLNKLSKEWLVEGPPKAVYKTESICDACQKGKQPSKPDHEVLDLSDKDEEVNEGDKMKPMEFIPFGSLPLKTFRRSLDSDCAEPIGNHGQSSEIPDLSHGDNSRNGDQVPIHLETPTNSIVQPEAELDQPVNPIQHNLRCKKQNSISTSTAEAEYIAAGICCAQILCKLEPKSDKVIFVGYPKETRGYEFYHPSDNKIFVARNGTFLEKEFLSAITSRRKAKEPRSHQKTKHIVRRYHIIREIVDRGDVMICKVDTDDNIADPLTKPLGKLKHEGHTRSMGIRPMLDWP